MDAEVSSDRTTANNCLDVLDIAVYISVPICTFIIALGLRTFVFLCYRRPCNDRSSMSLESTKRKDFYKSTLIQDLVIYSTLPVASCVFIYIYSVIDEPFYLNEQCLLPLPIRLTFLVLIAYLAQHIAFSVVIQQPEHNYKREILHYVIAISLYILILVTNENVITGLIGMGAMTPVGIATLRQCLRGNRGDGCGCYEVASMLRPFVILAAMLVTPLVLVSLSLKNQSLFGMSPLSIGYFVFCYIYFTVTFILILKESIIAALIDVGVSYSGNLSGREERARLLASYQIPNQTLRRIIYARRSFPMSEPSAAVPIKPPSYDSLEALPQNPPTDDVSNCSPPPPYSNEEP